MFQLNNLKMYQFCLRDLIPVLRILYKINPNSLTFSTNFLLLGYVFDLSQRTNQYFVSSNSFVAILIL